jgi:hypothetical protein
MKKLYTGSCSKFLSKLKLIKITESQIPDLYLSNYVDKEGSFYSEKIVVRMFVHEEDCYLIDVIKEENVLELIKYSWLVWNHPEPFDIILGYYNPKFKVSICL